jgi:uncharacterized protein (TIRG00374 family)
MTREAEPDGEASAMSGRARLCTVVTDGRLAVVGTLVLLVGGGAVAARTLDVGRAADAVVRADRWLLVLAVCLYAASWPLRGRRFGDVLAAMGERHGVRYLTALVFVSQTANLAVPARAGDGLRAYLLERQRSVGYATGGAALAVERVLDVLALAVLGGAGLAVLVTGGRSPGVVDARSTLVLAGGLGIGAVLVAGVTTVLARADRRYAPAIRARVTRAGLSSITGVSRVVDGVLRFGTGIRDVASRPRRIASVGGSSLVIWALDVATAVVVFAALIGVTGSGITLVLLAATGTLAVCAGNLAKVLPLSQGGVGLYEAAFAGIIAAVTPIPLAVAVAAAFVDHALKNAVTLLGGGIAAAGLNVSLSSPRGESTDRPSKF